jgi:hypothetical protein
MFCFKVIFCITKHILFWYKLNEDVASSLIKIVVKFCHIQLTLLGFSMKFVLSWAKRSGNFPGLIDSGLYYNETRRKFSSCQLDILNMQVGIIVKLNTKPHHRKKMVLLFRLHVA